MLKKKLKLYFKVFFQKLFILIYGKIKTDDINYLNDDELIPINNIKSDTYPDHEYFLYKFQSFHSIYKKVSNLLKYPLLISNPLYWV